VRVRRAGRVQLRLTLRTKKGTTRRIAITRRIAACR
jgi:hypothetical protein